MSTPTSSPQEVFGAFEALLGQWQLPALAQAVRQARADVEEALGYVDVSQREHIVLVASELVTNAVMHAATDISVIVEQWQNAIRIIVEDASSVLPTLSEVSFDADRGRGLHIVEQLCDMWGVEETTSGKKVWASFARS